MPTWLSLSVAAVTAVASAVGGWALWRIHRRENGLTLLVGAVLLWLVGLEASLVITLGELGLLP
ncbi:MAG: hypothetical protein A2V75_05760 [Actinobacteria bacterium RBG_16_70_17]|nr:MAG: hypothetical protein A2V75_05760 [Actinobacteria bacterium RBG_16_70_17]